MLRALCPVKPELKSSREIALMREAGKLVAQAHKLCKTMAVPGMATREIDQAVEALYRQHGATPFVVALLLQGVCSQRSQSRYAAFIARAVLLRKLAFDRDR